jgi:hypothetical protein
MSDILKGNGTVEITEDREEGMRSQRRAWREDDL